MEFIVWLFRIGRLSPDRAMAVMDRHLNHRRPLGRVALAAGMLDEAQVSEILLLQVREPNHARFGEIALRLGYLTIKDLERALVLQQRDIPPVDVVLSRVGGVPIDEQSALRSRFRDEMAA
jgi:hypothetical protein